MSDEFKEGAKPVESGKESLADQPDSKSKKQTGPNWLEMLARLGLGETIARIGTGILTLLLVIAVVILLRSADNDASLTNANTNASASEPTAVPSVDVASIPQLKASFNGVPRMALLHTNIPDRPRQDIIKYTIAKGDTVIGIAAKYHLMPQTIMFGNYYT
ncbi:MAG: LysM domain-containing protein, partial [Chloroflexi bacterium]|nr:LysM domain-containing protein [Chloroflexota bacterium]